MRVLIVEDESPAAERLIQLLRDQQPDLDILAVLDTVEDTVAWLRTRPAPDLLLLDIQLADGQSFDIFEQVRVEVPVIFTTAYDQYAIRAFEVNSIDYLLKPVEPTALGRALGKLERLQASSAPDWQALLAQVQAAQGQKPVYQQRFLVKIGEQYRSVPVTEVAYVMAADGFVLLVEQGGRQYPVDFKVEELAERLDPQRFYRINRKYIVSVESIGKIHSWFNSRLKLDLQPPSDAEVIVSRERVSDFKAWLNR